MDKELQGNDQDDELIINGKKNVEPIDVSNREPKESDLLGKMIEFANRYNGYDCISVSSLTAFVNDSKAPIGTTSALARRIALGFLLKSGGGKAEEFAKVFVNKPIVYVQAHKGIPILAKDGLYDAIDANHKVIDSRTVGEFVISEPEKFEPFILIKTGGKGNFGIIKGDPYHHVTPEEAASVLKMNQEPSEPNA